MRNLWQTIQNGQNRKISLCYVQTDRLASHTKVFLVFEDRPPKMAFNPTPNFMQIWPEFWP